MHVFTRNYLLNYLYGTSQQNAEDSSALSFTYETYEYSQDRLNHFIRRPMGEESDDIYGIFGMSRREAASLMKRNLSEIKEMIGPAIEAALTTDSFLNYLIERGVIPEEKPDEAKSTERRGESSAHSPVNPGKELGEHIRKIKTTHQMELLVRDYVKDDNLLEKLITPVASLVHGLKIKRILSEEEKERLPHLNEVFYAYILYDVSLGRVNSGVSPACILHALARLDRRTLYLRSLDKTANGSDNEDGLQAYEIILDLSSSDQFKRLKAGEQDNKLSECSIPNTVDKSFLAFGATREEVYELLTSDLWASGSGEPLLENPKQNSLVKMIIKKALRAALIRSEFYKYLVSDVIPFELKDCIKNKCVNDYLEEKSLPPEIGKKLSACRTAAKERNILEILRDHVDPSGQVPAAGRIFFDALETDSVLIHAYLHFDLIQQKVEKGWSDPLVLLAYGTLKGMKVNMWKRNTWSKGTVDYMNLVPVNFLVDCAKNTERSICVSDVKLSDTVPFYDWLDNARHKTTRELNVLMTEANQFERLEVLSKHEFLTDEKLSAVHAHKAESKEETNKKTLARFLYKMTNADQFHELVSSLHSSKQNELQKFYENTAKDAILNNLWSVLRYLIKDSEIRQKLEIKQLKKIQDLELMNRSLSDRSGILQRIRGLLEYLNAAFELREHPITSWEAKNDEEKIKILQLILDKIFEEHQSILIRDYAGYTAPKDEDFVTDDLELISKSPKEKTEEYTKIVRSYFLPFNAMELMGEGSGIQKSIQKLTKEIDELASELENNKEAVEAIAKLIGLRDSSILGKCTNDRINVDTFLEGKDEFANKYGNAVIQILGREIIDKFNAERMQLGLPEGDFLYEFFGKYPPSISPNTVYENENNLLHIAVIIGNFPLVRGLVILGVDPAMKNNCGQRPAEMLLDSYYAGEIGALMNMRISLDNQLKKGQAEHSAWFQKENALMNSFGAYTQLVSSPIPDKSDPERAENDKKKMTIYSPTLYSPISYLYLQGPGLFYAGMVERLTTLDQKMDYILSFFRQLISIDKICFVNPFNATLDKLASLMNPAEENVEKIVAVKKSQIELFRLRQLVFDSLIRGDKYKDYSNHIADIMNLELNIKDGRGVFLPTDEELCSRALYTFNNVRVALSIYENIEAQSLARHAVENDLPLMNCIEEKVIKDLKHESFPIKCYRDIFSEMNQLVLKYRDKKIKFGKHPDITILTEVKRELALLIIEHDHFDEKSKTEKESKKSDTIKHYSRQGQQLGGGGQVPSDSDIGYRRVHCDEDNSTLFNAVQFQMQYFKYQSSFEDGDLKAKVIAHMTENRALYISGAIKDADALLLHLKSLSDGSCAAGKREIYAIVRLFNVHVHVHQPDGQLDEYGDIESSHKIHLGQTKEGFYFSMVPKNITRNKPNQESPYVSPNFSPQESRTPPVIFTQKMMGDRQPGGSLQRPYT